MRHKGEIIAEHPFNKRSQLSLWLLMSSCKSGLKDLLLEIRIPARDTDLG